MPIHFTHGAEVVVLLIFYDKRGLCLRIALFSSVCLCMWSSRIQPWDAAACASHGCILGTHMNKCILLHNVMGWFGT